MSLVWAKQGLAILSQVEGCDKLGVGLGIGLGMVVVLFGGGSVFLRGRLVSRPLLCKSNGEHEKSYNDEAIAKKESCKENSDADSMKEDTLTQASSEASKDVLSEENQTNDQDSITAFVEQSPSIEPTLSLSSMEDSLSTCGLDDQGTAAVEVNVMKHSDKKATPRSITTRRLSSSLRSIVSREKKQRRSSIPALVIFGADSAANSVFFSQDMGKKGISWMHKSLPNVLRPGQKLPDEVYA